MLHATQTVVRALVGSVSQPFPSPMQPMLSPPGVVGIGDPNLNPSMGGVYPDGTTKPMRVADSIFKIILEAMRPAPKAGEKTAFPAVNAPSFPSPGTPAIGTPSFPTLLPTPNMVPAGVDNSSGIEQLFKSLVTELEQAGRTQGKMEMPVRAALGEISYRNTEYGTPLSVFIKKQLQAQLSQSGAFVVEEAPRLRGIGGITKPKSVTALAEGAGADVVINGNYWDAPEAVELFLSMRQREGNVVLGTSKVMLPSRLLPKEAVPVPANLKEAQLNELDEDRIAPLSGLQTSNPLKIEVWTDRGKGAIYGEGDEVVVMVRANQEAYLRLYYTDANNQTHQIFPNPYRRDGKIPGGVVVTIPAPEDRFAFKVKAPFGVEAITAIGSRKPFHVTETTGIFNGPFQRVSQGLRGVAVVSSSAGEGEAVRDSTVLSTVPRMP